MLDSMQLLTEQRQQKSRKHSFPKISIQTQLKRTQ